MSFIESPRFPDKIAAESRFGPAYSTSIARNFGGYEFANRNWSMPLYEGDVMHGAKTQALLDELLAYFHEVAGMFNGFRYWNPNDYLVTGSQGTLVAIGALGSPVHTSWQMHKKYTYGALNPTRKISKPCTGCTILGSGSYSYDTATGIVTVLSGAAPTGWTGRFDFPVRFNTDKFIPTSLTKSAYRLDALPIIEVRL